jgi:hypothetical protein
MRRLPLYLAWVVLCAASAWSQNAHDVLYLQDGHERVGELMKLDSATVTFWVRGEEAATTFPRADVQRVDLSRKRAGDDAQTVAELNDPLLTRVLKLPSDKADYPDSGHVVLYSLLDCRLEADGSYTVHERNIIKVLLERGKDEANVARDFFKGEETLDLDFARTINPDGSITPISDAALSINSLKAGTPEYEKLYELKFAMKQVREGSVLDYQVTKHRSATSLLYPFYTRCLLRGSEPILESELRIDLPRSLELALRTDRLESNVESTREEHGDRVTYGFVAKQCPRVVPEPMMPPATDVYPRITAALKADWAAIGRAFGEAARANSECSDEMRAKVAELVAGSSDPKERAERIYYYFIQAVHQLYVPIYQYGYTPHPVGEVFSRRAGNSLDKALLLSVLLREAGLDAGVALVRQQYGGHLLEDVPCIRQLDSALVAVQLPAGRQFLSVTDDVTRFGQMPSSYQGAGGLLVMPTGSELVEVPVNAAADEAESAAYKMRVLPSGDLEVTKLETPTGNYEMGDRRAWKDLKDEELRRRFERALTAVNAQAKLEKYEIENLHDVTQPLRITETYTLTDYAMRVGSKLLAFQLPEVYYEASAVGKPTREFPLYWGQRYETSMALRIEIPEGYRVYYAGRDWAADSDSASFTSKFSATDHEVVYRDKFVQKLTDAPADKYGEYKTCVETMSRVPKEWILLERVE